jgi:polyvinyl alcohol dehydrogenase (cytochrome)
MRRRVAAVITLSVVVLAAQVGLASAAPATGETLGNQHADLSASITATNAHSLRAAWFVRTAGPVSATPIFWRDSVLLSDWSGRVWRVNALTGKTIWQRRLETPDTTWPWYGLAGTGVVADGVLVEVGVEGNAWGLNATTGQTVWGPTYLGTDPSMTNDPNARYVGNLSDLLYGGGLVYVGMSSCEEPLAEIDPLFVPTARGSIVALDPTTGALAWQTWLTPPGDTGVPVWSSFALDSSTDTLYTDTGNNYTSPATPLSDAVLALNAATGTPLWDTQLTANDTWPAHGPDADFGAGPQLFTAPGPGGTTLRLVGAMQKDGLYTAFDRATGAIVWQRRVASGLNDSRGEASIGHARLFAWADGSLRPGSDEVTIAALAPGAGRPIWQRIWAKANMISDAGFLSHGVYLVGDGAGALRAYRSSDGELLWHAVTPGHAAVCSSLWVAGRFLYVGVGLSQRSKLPYGLAAYRVP